MKITIELPKELEKYKDDFINYTIEAIKSKKTNEDAKTAKSKIKSDAELNIEKIKIDNKTWKDIKEEKKAEADKLEENLLWKR